MVCYRFTFLTLVATFSDIRDHPSCLSSCLQSLRFVFTLHRIWILADCNVGLEPWGPTPLVTVVSTIVFARQMTSGTELSCKFSVSQKLSIIAKDKLYLQDRSHCWRSQSSFDCRKRARANDRGRAAAAWYYETRPWAHRTVADNPQEDEVIVDVTLDIRTECRRRKLADWFPCISCFYFEE